MDRSPATLVFLAIISVTLAFSVYESVLHITEARRRMVALCDKGTWLTHRWLKILERFRRPSEEGILFLINSWQGYLGERGQKRREQVLTGERVRA